MDKHAVREATSNAQDHPVLTGVVVSGAGLVGYKVFRDEVVAGAYDSLKNDGAFGDLKNEGNFSKKDLYSPYIKGLREKTIATRDAAINGEKPKGYADDIAKDRIEFFEKVEARKKAMGINGIRDEWKIAQRGFRDAAILKGVGIASVTLGSTLALAQFFLKKGSSAEPETFSEAVQR